MSKESCYKTLEIIEYCARSFISDLVWLFIYSVYFFLSLFFLLFFSLFSENSVDSSRSVSSFGPQPWHSCHKLIYVRPNPKTGVPVGHWPIPESFWPDQNSPALVSWEAWKCCTGYPTHGNLCVAAWVCLLPQTWWRVSCDVFNVTGKVICSLGMNMLSELNWGYILISMITKYAFSVSHSN